MRYPFKPGARPGLTPATTKAIQDAADIAAPTAPALQGLCLDELRIAKAPLSCEDIQFRLEAQWAQYGRRILLTTVRARVCQAHRQGLVVDSGERGLGESQRASVVKWRLTTTEEQATFQAARRADWIARQEGAR